MLQVQLEDPHSLLFSAVGAAERSQNVLKVLLVVVAIVAVLGAFFAVMGGLAAIMEFVETRPWLQGGLLLGSATGLILSYILWSPTLAEVSGAVLLVLVWWWLQ